jgi:hypothetical protein
LEVNGTKIGKLQVITAIILIAEVFVFASGLLYSGNKGGPQAETNTSIFQGAFLQNQPRDAEMPAAPAANGAIDAAQLLNDRIAAGTEISKAYTLLDRYDKIIPIVASFTSVAPAESDAEVWQRAKAVYEWMGGNYGYCSDKVLCVGPNKDYCYDFQFFSPNELLGSDEDSSYCGDCDDHAQLFAGMMYASGVQHDKVRVVCGSGHCWNQVLVNNKAYDVDTTCSHAQEMVNLFGWSITSQNHAFPSDYASVTCSSHTPRLWYDAYGYHAA